MDTSRTLWKVAVCQVLLRRDGAFDLPKSGWVELPTDGDYALVSGGDFQLSDGIQLKLPDSDIKLEMPEGGILHVFERDHYDQAVLMPVLRPLSFPETRAYRFLRASL